MEKDCGSWWQHCSWQSPNLNYASIPHDPGQQNVAHPVPYPVYGNHCSASASRTAAGFAVPEQTYCGNELQAWYSCYPQQTLTMTPKSIPGEKFYVSQCGEAAPNQKRFLVFDQSGNQTRLIFSSVGYPFQNPISPNLKPSVANVSNVALPINKDTLIPDYIKAEGQYGLDAKYKTDVSGGSGSEMHEDTAELDALLCSDDEEEEEETSTGHSPSEIIGYEKNEVDDGDEVASSVTPAKRKRVEGEHDLSLVDTASSGKEGDRENDAQSSCIKGGISEGSLASKKLRIRETVGILRSIIPGGKGKDATAVLDQAIHYLKSMRLKAKALGAATLMQQQQQQ